MDNDFLPYGATETIGQVVNFVHHYIAQVLQQSTARIEHVAEYLCGHDHHPGARVNARIASE